MRGWDLGSREHASAAVAVSACLLAGAVAWAAIGVRRPAGGYVRELVALSTGAHTPEMPERSSNDALARAQTATLWDELFPVALAPTPEPPPPTLGVDLIAIIGPAASDDGTPPERPSERRRAFVYDKATQTYQELAVGEALGSADGGPAPGAARLVSVGDRFAVFQLAGRDIRVELAP